MPDQCWMPHTAPGPAQGSPNCFEQDLWCQRAAGGCSPSAHQPPPLFTRVRNIPQGSWWGQCENPGLVLRTPRVIMVVGASTCPSLGTSPAWKRWSDPGLPRHRNSGSPSQTLAGALESIWALFLAFPPLIWVFERLFFYNF